MKTVCSNCVLDTTVSDIEFDDKGVCNYCRDYYLVEKGMPSGIKAKKELEQMVKRIKRDKGRSEYDCIVGISGGVDSTYLLYLVKQLGLNPLAVHIDTGWNSEISVNNVHELVKKLNIDLITYVIDWTEMKDLQLAFFRSSVPDCDVPQDHVFPAILHKIAWKKRIKHLISGHNVVTEYIIPRNWSFNSNDYSHIMDIHKKFGSKKLKKYPLLTPFKRFVFYKYIFKIQSHRPLNFIEYNKENIVQFISNELGWRSYGNKHEESRFTKFFQNYYLFKKFGFDKRKAHLSNLIVSGQIGKSEALEILNNPPYEEKWLSRELDYMLRKLGITKDEWKEIMENPPKNHNEYASDENLLFVKILRYLSKIKSGK